MQNETPAVQRPRRRLSVVLWACAAAALLSCVALTFPKPSSLVVAGLLGLGLLVYLLAKPERVFLAMVFCLPMWGVGIFDVGVTLTLSKMFAALLIVQILVVHLQRPGSVPFPWESRDRYLVIFWVYGLAVSLIALFFLDRVVRFEGATLRGPVLRFFSQLIVLALMVGVYFATRIVVRDHRTLRRTIRVVLISFGISAVYGLYQFVGYRFGWPLTDLRQGASGITRVGLYLNMTRISSLAGEPKGLALIMIPVIVMLLAFRASGNTRWGVGRRNFAFLMLLLAVFVGTFARSGYILLPISLLGIHLLRGNLGTRRMWTAVLVCVLILGAVGLVGTRVMGINLLDVFVFRVGEVSMEQWEVSIEYPKVVAALKTALRHPVFGVGLGNATFHIKRSLSELRYVTLHPVENPHCLFLLIWTEMGLVGLALFLLFLVGTLVSVWRRVKSMPDSETRDTSVALLCAAFSMVVAHAYVSWLTQPFLWFWLALARAAADLPPVETRPSGS
jgi:O-antigen ligase